MKKIISSLLIFITLFFVLSTLVSAKAGATPAPSPTPQPEVVNSFELFWPMVAGKTRESKTYFLKILKEKIRNFLIFAPAQKADNNVFLSVKRLLESETLLNVDKKDLATLTLKDAQSEVEKAIGSVAKAKKDELSPVSGQMKERLSKMQKLIALLVDKKPDAKQELQSLDAKIKDLLSKLQ